MGGGGGGGGEGSGAAAAEGESGGSPDGGGGEGGGHLSMPFLARHVRGRPLVAHAHVDDVAASLEQPLDAPAVAGRCREVERQQLGRIAVPEERLDRRPAEQLCDRTLACLQRSVVQRGVLLRVRDGGVGVGREQQSQQLDVPHGGGDVQRGAAVAVLRVLVAAMLHQQRAHLWLLFTRGVA